MPGTTRVNTPAIDDGTYFGLDVDGGTPTAAGSRVRPRRGTAAQWAAANPTLGVGERGLETDTGIEKTGDGLTPWTALRQDGIGGAVTLPLLTGTTPFYIAHRGGGDEAPEHTLIAYETAANLGMQGIEVSVQRTADWHIICMHDTTLDRTTTASGTVIASNLADLQNNYVVDIGATINGPSWDPQPIPTLHQVMNSIGQNALLFLEPKQADSATVTRIFRVLDRYPWAKIVWKFSTPTGGGLPAHAVLAAARGYWTWSYLGTSNTTAEIAAAAAAADILGVPIGATDNYITSVVTAAAVYGKKVIVYEVHRRSEVTRCRALGVQGYMCSGPNYVPATTTLAPSSNWASGIRAPGEIPHDTFASNTNLPTFDTANRAVITATSNRSLLLGWASSGTAATSYTISFALRWLTVPTSTTHSDLVFCQTDDSGYQHQVTTNAGGYHLVVRGSGLVQLFKHDPGTTVGTALGTNLQTAVPTNGGWMTFTVQVTATQIIWQRTDDASSAVTVSDTSYRGAYIHVASGSTDQPAHWRDVSIA
jgi:glycerophosphoryl diester phosphodiesterase